MQIKQPMSILNNFLDFSAKDAIEKAIQMAEQTTSGEIRVHLDKKGGDDPFEEAKKIFERLGMTRTEERNGVLIYLCFSRKQIAILGDKGINEKVSNTYWDDIYHSMVMDFQQEKYQEGLCNAVLEIGNKLSTYFPLRDKNPDELSNEITEA